MNLAIAQREFSEHAVTQRLMAMGLIEKDEIPQPKSLSFAHINEYVHQTGVNFEDLAALCLQLAATLEKTISTRIYE